MTLDEAIERAEEVAELQEKMAKEWHKNQVEKCKLCSFAEMDYTRENESKKCAEEHLQLAEWLKELKAYQEAYEEMRKLPIVWEFGEGVSRCLSIIEDCLKEVNADADSD